MSDNGIASTREKALLVALALFSAVNVVCWIHVVPLADAPDEPSHFEVVSFELVFRRIPEVGVDDFGATMKVARDGYRSPHYTYSAQPGLSYIVSAAAIELLGDRSPESAIYARYPGILWAALMPLVVYFGVAWMAPSLREAAPLAAIVATFWPQLTFIFSYLNNDGLTALVSAALISSWYAGARQGWRLRDALLTGGLVGLVLLNKPNGFPVAAMTAIAMLVTLRGGFRRTFARSAAAIGVAIAVSGWWYLIAMRRYGFDLLAERRADAIREGLGISWASGRTYGMSFFETALGPFPRYGESWLRGTLTSAVGRFGEFWIVLPGLVYTVVGCVSLLAFVGVLAVLRRREWIESRRMAVLQLVAYSLIPLELALALYRSWAFDFQAQGRYLFPALLPYFALLGIGLACAFAATQVRRAAGLVSSLFFAMLAFYSFAVVLLDAYRLSLVELLIARPLVGGTWTAAATVVTIAIVVYWLGRDDSESARGMRRIGATQ